MKIILSGCIVFIALTLSFAQPATTAINAIQGEGQVSPLAGKQVTTSGVVTALVKKGFYIQTPDAEVDKNPQTSEGIYVFTNEAPTDMALGNLVRVTGTVTEYTPRGVLFSANNWT